MLCTYEVYFVHIILVNEHSHRLEILLVRHTGYVVRIKLLHAHIRQECLKHEGVDENDTKCAKKFPHYLLLLYCDTGEVEYIIAS